MDETITKKQAIEAISKANGLLYWNNTLKASLIKLINEIPPKESETFEWCTDCKEYDQEAHCCHRYSKVIRNAVDEMQIVHCIECRYSEYDSYYNDRYCHYDGKAELVDDYHFCRNGEK